MSVLEVGSRQFFQKMVVDYEYTQDTLLGVKTWLDTDTGEAAIIYDIYVIHGCCITYLASVPNRRTELSTCITSLRS